MPRAGQHSWTQEGERFERHTDRACYACGLIKRTRHEAHVWQEFYKRQPDGSLVKIDGRGTPTCPGSPQQQAITFSPKRNVITNGDASA